MAAFTVLWVMAVYFPLAHMVRGKGGFLNAVLGGAVPALDFAGGAKPHHGVLSAGAAAVA